MSVPNYFDVVQHVFDRGGFDLTTHDGGGLFTEACARALHAQDPAFGHLRKTPGHNQFNGHAVDSVLYKPTGQSIDLIADSETPKGRPAWQEDIPRYTDAAWYAPDGVGAADPPVEPLPVDPPTPPPVTPPAPELVLAALARIEAKVDALARQSDANTERVLQRIEQVVEDTERTAAAYLPLFRQVLEKLMR